MVVVRRLASLTQCIMPVSSSSHRLLKALALGRSAVYKSSLARITNYRLRTCEFCSSNSPDITARGGDDSSAFASPESKGNAAAPPKVEEHRQSSQGGSNFEAGASSFQDLRDILREEPRDGGGGSRRQSGTSSSSSSSAQARGSAARAWERDTDFEDIFSVSSTSQSAAQTKSGERAFWKSFLKGNEAGEASSFGKQSGENSSWDFLKEIDTGLSRGNREGQSSTQKSFRKLGDTQTGFDFLTEAPDSPARDSEPREEGTGEESVLHSASFKLLYESFQKTSLRREPTKESSGLEFETLLSSQEAWAKPVDPRSLAELDGNFYSSLDREPAQEQKVYTYEELGDKLRKVRPPREQQLFGATGLSFRELRDRLEKIEKMESESAEPDALKDFKELTESLNELRHASPKVASARKQLSYEELAFLNSISTGISPRIQYIPPKDDLLMKYYSPEQMSSKELLSLEINKMKKEFQMHESDSGSSQVQIAILTAKINNLNRHLKEGCNYKRDKHSRKGLNDMVQYRKRLLRYLRRRDWDVYCNVLTKLNLNDIILEKRTK